jgi:hypothetical protein
MKQYQQELSKQQIDALNAIRNSKGRFFGLYTTQGSVINAQFVSETDSYIHVYDRNKFANRKLAKTSVAKVNI